MLACLLRWSADVCIELCNSFISGFCKVRPQLCDGSTVIHDICSSSSSSSNTNTVLYRLHNGSLSCVQLCAHLKQAVTVHIAQTLGRQHCNRGLCIAGVNKKTFHRCRAGNPTGQYFTINECSVGQVMCILSAEAGFSERYSVQGWPPLCPWSNCTRPTDVPARECNGRRSCSISQLVLIYPQGSVRALCPLQRDGNFIRIKFMCITGTTFTMFSLL